MKAPLKQASCGTWLLMGPSCDSEIREVLVVGCLLF